MLSLALGLTFASFASAQVFSMVDVNASGSAASSSSTSAPPASTDSSSSDYSSAAPTVSVSSSDSPSYTQYGNNQYTSPPAQYTPPPQTKEMPYESFMNGGYKSMECGYGYQKGYDGGCISTESWVRNLLLQILSAI